MHRWVPSLRNSFVLDHGPFWSFAVGMLGVTAVVLPLLATWEAQTLQAIEAQTLTADDLVRATNTFRIVWSVSLVGFVLCLGLGSLVALRNHRSLVRRVERIVAYSQADGAVADPLQPLADDVLGSLEAAMGATAQRALERDQQLRRELQRQQFSSELHRALELADDEEAICGVVGHAVAVLGLGTGAALLLGDHSHAHLELAWGDTGRLCPVTEPSRCAAVRRGHTLRFDDPGALDACRYLRDRSQACSGVCAPVAVMGRAVGVLHVIDAPGAAPDEGATRQLETITTMVGERLGLVRSLEKSRLQARVDGLTGLLNRRTFEDEAQRALGHGDHVLLLADLDHFKRLNDTHGHSVGDAALRLFSELLQQVVREGDLVGRYGGEEIVVLLVDADRAAAENVLARIRSSLATSLEISGMPRFTASFGAALATDGARIDRLLAQADAALYAAKDGGRDRWVFSGDPPPRLAVAT